MAMLVTERLLIRPFEPADLDELHAVFSDPEVMRHSGGVYSRERTAEALRTNIEMHAEEGIAFWAVVERSTGRLLGDTGLGRLGDEIEIGWTLRRDAWGKGYATEAGRAALRHGLGALGLDYVIATIEPGNHASVNVARKLGMRPDGHMRRPDDPEGVDHLRFVAP